MGLFSSCETFKKSHKKPASAPTPTSEIPLPNTNPAPMPKVEDYIDRMEFWKTVTMPSIDMSEGETVYEAFGFTISLADYNNGLRTFLNGYPRTEELEKNYREQLSQELMILRWTEESGRLNDLVFRVEARQTLRDALSTFVFENSLHPKPVTNLDIEQRYNELINQYSTPEKTQVQIILVPTPEDAQSVLDRLDKGESLDQLAFELSKHESREEYGKLDPFPRGTYIAELEEIAFSLSPGEISTINASAGTFVVKKIAHIQPYRTPLEEVRQDLREQLETEYLQEARVELMDQIQQQIKRTAGNQ